MDNPAEDGARAGAFDRAQAHHQQHCDELPVEYIERTDRFFIHWPELDLTHTVLDAKQLEALRDRIIKALDERHNAHVMDDVGRSAKSSG